MPQVVRYPRAPIKEAVLEIKVKLPPHANLETLLPFAKLMQDQYPSRQTRMSWRSGFKAEEGGKPVVFEPSGEAVGYFLTSADGKRIAQALLTGFVFSWLSPYDTWDSFRDAARLLWEEYKKVTSPLAVTRISLRYINRIEIPLPMNDFNDYILTFPQIAQGLPQGMSNFFVRLEVPYTDLGILSVITETMDVITEPSKLPLIFDIDVIRETLFQPVSEDIWKSFEKLRDVKNEIFFNSLTSKAKELFQ